MFSMIMGSFDGFRSMLFGFSSMTAPPPPAEDTSKAVEAKENQQDKPYGYDAERPTRGTRLVERMDGDGDGGLSWNELGETRRGRRIARNFDKIDSDGDGKLTAMELDSFRKSRRHGGMHVQQVQPAPEAQAPVAAAVQSLPQAPAVAPVQEEPAPQPVPAPAAEETAQQSFFFAMSSSGSTAQQASSSYDFVLALFR